MAGEISIRALAVWAVVGLGWCLFVTLAARRYSARRVYALWAVFMTTAFFLTSGRPLLDPSGIEPGLGFSAFFLFLTLGLPSVIAAWMALRRASRSPPGHVLLDFVIVAACFVVVLPFAALLALSPEFVTFFR